MKRVSYILSLILMSTFAALAAGEVDTTFSASTYLNQNQGAIAVVGQPDGKVVVGGAFTVTSGVARAGLARFNTDGTLDGTFNPPDFFDPSNFPSLGGLILSLNIQSNGKILVGGRFGILGSTRISFVRLNSDGSLDTSFGDLSAQLAPTSLVRSIRVRPDDSIF